MDLPGLAGKILFLVAMATLFRIGKMLFFQRAQKVRNRSRFLETIAFLIKANFFAFYRARPKAVNELSFNVEKARFRLFFNSAAVLRFDSFVWMHFRFTNFDRNYLLINGQNKYEKMPFFLFSLFLCIEANDIDSINQLFNSELRWTRSQCDATTNTSFFFNGIKFCTERGRGRERERQKINSDIFHILGNDMFFWLPSGGE